MTSSKKVVVVDYGLGNLLSVGRALEAAGAEVSLTSSPRDIETAEKLVLPGVGAFGAGMEGLKSIGVVDALKAFARHERPMLGICLGMQMMLEKSEEFGSFAGLGFLSGSVRKLPEQDARGGALRIPHIGWAKAHIASAYAGNAVWRSSEDRYFYFVHSFYADPANSAEVSLTLRFGNRDVPVGIQRGNAMGVQFHPEKSGEPGLGFLRSFLST
jgi:glutamine amidotransferase